MNRRVDILSGDRVAKIVARSEAFPDRDLRAAVLTELALDAVELTGAPDERFGRGRISVNATNVTFVFRRAYAGFSLEALADPGSTFDSRLIELIEDVILTGLAASGVDPSGVVFHYEEGIADMAA